MNKRQIKKFCKKGGHYHFDPTIRKISKKRMMYPYVTHGHYGYMITWHEVGTCLTCLHCTDVMIDWSGEPYACYSNTIRCSGCDNFSCKRYKLDNEIEFFKFAHIYSHSPESDAKRYIDEQINDLHKNSKPIEYPVPFTSEDFKEARIASENDLMNELIGKFNTIEDGVLATLTEVWSTRPDVDINDRSIHYFVMYSDKADIFEIGEKYLIKVCDKTRCAICVEKNSSNEVTFLNAIVLEDEDPCMCYEFSESDGDKFLCCGDLIPKENKDE